MEPTKKIKDAIHNIPSIAKRSVGLSNALEGISFGIVGSPLTSNINRIAEHFTDLSCLTQQLGELLALKVGSYHYTSTLLNDAGACLCKLDSLVYEFENALLSINQQRPPRKFARFFKDSNVNDLTRLVVDPIKKPLQVIISHLRISVEYHQEKSEDKITALSRECDFAESRVESSKYVIKALLDAEQQHRKGGVNDLLQSGLCKETWGGTALWMYNLIFARTFDSFPAAQRLNPQGRAHTVRTGDEDSSDPTQEHLESLTDSIPYHIEREIEVTQGLKRHVVNELLLSWASLRADPVRQMTDSSGDSSKARLQNSVPRIVQWFIDEENLGSPATERNGYQQRWMTETVETSRPRAPSPLTAGTRDAGFGSFGLWLIGEAVADTSVKGRGVASSFPDRKLGPKSRSDGVLPEEPLSRLGTTNLQGKEGPGSRCSVRAVDLEIGEVFNEPERRVGGENGNYDKREQSETDPRGKRKSQKAQQDHDDGPLPGESSRAPITGKSKQPDRQEMASKPGKGKDRAEPATITDDPTLISRADSSRRVTYQITDPIKGKATAKEEHGHDNHRTSSRSRLTQSRPGASKATFDAPLPGKGKTDKESDDIPSDDKQNAKRAKQAGNRQRRSSVIHQEDTKAFKSYHAPSIPQPRHAETISAPVTLHGARPFDPYALGMTYPHHSLPQPPHPPHYPTSGHLVMPSYNTVHPRSAPDYMPYYQESGASKAGEVALVAVNQRIEKESKERRDAEEASKEERRKKAEQDERHRTEQREDVQELHRIIKQMAEKEARFQALEEEKRSIERRLREREASDEEVQRRANGSNMYSKEVLEMIMEKVEKAERQSADKWAIEKEKIEKNLADMYDEALERQHEQITESYQATIEQERIKTREAEDLARRWVKHYHELAASCETEDEDTNVEEDRAEPTPVLDPLKYQVKAKDVDSAADNSSICEPIPHTLPIDEKNPWGEDWSPFDRAMEQPRNFPQYQNGVHAIPDTSTSLPPGPYRILFPPRAGWSESGPTQISNYLASTGFKAEFEVRAPPRFQNTASSGNVLRGTLFWLPPTSTAEAEVYRSLRDSGWRPTYVRTTSTGKTWFFGCQPVHAQFFSDMYKPQVGPVDSNTNTGIERESLIISKDLIEIEELDFLGHIYKQRGNEIYLDPTLTSEDIDHIVARSLLAREGRYRKMFRKTNFRFEVPRNDLVPDVVEVESVAGESVTSGSSEGRERRSSLWPFREGWSVFKWHEASR